MIKNLTQVLKTSIVKYTLFILALQFLFLVSNGHTFNGERPKLVVGIVVEQMRYEMLSRYWDVLSDDGIKKLISEGTLYNNAYHNVFFTQNSTGVASIVSGTHPNFHGIISDYWINKLSTERIYCINGKSEKLSSGFISHFDFDPTNYMSSTLGDEIKIAYHDRSKVISVAMNPVSAVLGGGKSADYAFWFDDITGKWETSGYYSDSMPQWVNSFNDKGFQDIYMNRTWATSLSLENNYKQSLPDDNAFEPGFKNYRNTFPYELKFLKQRAGNYKYLKYNPFGVTYTKDFALSAILEEQLGQDEYPDFMFISFSVAKYINELFGPRSVEMEDFFIKLDQEIAHLIKFLEENIGTQNTLVFMTSDRGVDDLPEYRKHMGQEVGEFDIYQSFTLLESYLNIYYQEGEWISGYYGKQIFLNRSTLDRCGVELSDVEHVISDFMIQYNGVSHAVGSQLLQKIDFDSGIQNLMQNSYNQKRSGDIFINYELGWREKGLPYSELNNGETNFRHVPIIWYGWNVKKNNLEYKRADVIDIAPTITQILRISAPTSTVGNPMVEIINNQ